MVVQDPLELLLFLVQSHPLAVVLADLKIVVLLALEDQVVVAALTVPALHLAVLEILLAPHHHKEIMAAIVVAITHMVAAAEAVLVRLEQRQYINMLEMVAMVPHHLSLALL